MAALRILGVDPGLRRTGWGVIDVRANHLSHVAHGRVESADRDDLATRLARLYEGLEDVLARFAPGVAAVEQTFVNKDPVATLKLGQARAVALLVPARAGVPVAEYAPNMVKKSVVGAGHAAKEQVHHMVRVLLPACGVEGPDEADALAVAITHAHFAQSAAALGRLQAARR